MSSRFRTKTAPRRETAKERVEPARFFFISVEGENTERNYFEFLNEYLDNSSAVIKVLEREPDKHNSAPKHVVDRLDRFASAREDDSFLVDVTDLYGIIVARELIKLPPFYQKGHDFFAAVVDRDEHTNPKENLEYCLEKCREQGYGFYLSNPCFEFWLLLHICDIEKEFPSPEDKARLLLNRKVSKPHTVASKKVSYITNDGKNMKKETFAKHYIENIDDAIEQAEKYATDFPELYDHLGTNLPELLKLILPYKKKEKIEG